MLKYVLLTFIILSHVTSFGQAKDSVKTFEFYKYRNDKKVKLKTGKPIVVFLKKDTLESLTIDKFLSGNFYSLNDSSIILNCYRSETTLLYKDSVKRISSYNSKPYLPQGRQSIPITKIDYIHRESNSSEAISAFAALGLVAAIISPIISYNSSQNKFNSKRYYSIMIPGYSSFIILGTISVLIDTRKIKVKRG